jgi:chromosome segregation ATPase
MIKQIEHQIRELQKDLIEAQKKLASLRLQPCRGDMEIRQKEGRLEEVEKGIKSINEKIRDLYKKRHEIMAENLKKEGYESPFV